MKLRKVKLLVSLIIVLVTVSLVCNVNSLATTPAVTIKPGNSSTNSALTNEATDNTKATEEQGATKNSANNKAGNTNKASNNTNTNSNSTNKNESNTSTNSTKKSKLPYAGTNGTVVFIVVALVASAVYAYKKVSDYNI
jgi:hypothetical protein